MLVIKVELHSAITGEVTELGRTLIANDGTGGRDTGSYDVKVLRKGYDVELNPHVQWHEAAVTRSGRVENYPRLSYNVWRLVCRALKSTFHEENEV